MKHYEIIGLTPILKIVKSVHRFEEREGVSMKSWILKIAANCARDRLKLDIIRRRHEENLAVQVDEEHKTDSRMSEDIKQAVVDFLKELPEHYRLPVWLYYLEEMTFREVGNVLSLPETTTRERVEQGIEQMKKALATAGYAVSPAALAGAFGSLQVEAVPAALTSDLSAMIAGKMPLINHASILGKIPAMALPMKVTAGIIIAGAVAVGGAVVAQKKVGGQMKTPVTASAGIMAGKVGDKTLLGAPDFRPIPEYPVGWRGDGSGRYPGATPPLEWHRTIKNPVGFACQAMKPGANAPKIENQHSIGFDQWLAIGPYLAGDHVKGMEESQIPEATIEPQEGDKAGAFVWKKMPMDSQRARLAEIFGYDKVWTDNYHHWEVKETRIIYAHTYVYADRACNAIYRLKVNWAAGGVRIWINGEKKIDQINAPDWTDSYVTFPLKKGWNRFLVKSWGYNNGWCFTSWLEEIPDKIEGYDEKNIAWSVPTTGWGYAPPTVVGDRLFLTVQPYYLVCLDKRDGKFRWIRRCDYFNATDPATVGKLSVQRQKIDENLKKTDAINLEIIQIVNSGQSPVAKLQERQAVDTVLDALIKDVDVPRSKLLVSAAGSGEPTTTTAPCSDGKNVYVFFQQAVASCFDLDGNRQWTTVVDHPTEWAHHGWGISPVLADGKFFARQMKLWAFDAKTGQVVWSKDSGNGNYAALMVARLGKQSVLFDGGGIAYKTADGALWGDNDKPRWMADVPSPTVIDDQHIFMYDQARQLTITGAGPGPGELSYKALKKPLGLVCDIPSPLIHNGLLYQISGHTGPSGLLQVMDLKDGSLVYSRQLDTTSRHMAHGGPGLTSSPAIVGDKLYVMDDCANTFIIQTGREFKLLGRNVLQDFTPMPPWDPPGNHRVMSTPVFDENRMYIRTGSYGGGMKLWCVGEMARK